MLRRHAVQQPDHLLVKTLLGRQQKRALLLCLPYAAQKACSGLGHLETVQLTPMIAFSCQVSNLELTTKRGVSTY